MAQGNALKAPSLVVISSAVHLRSKERRSGEVSVGWVEIAIASAHIQISLGRHAAGRALSRLRAGIARSERPWEVRAAESVGWKARVVYNVRC